MTIQVRRSRMPHTCRRVTFQMEPTVIDCDDLGNVLPKFESEEEDWRSFGYLLDSTDLLRLNDDADRLESEVEHPASTQTKPTVRKATTSHGAHVKHVVINPADISLGGDVVDWTKKSGREPSKVKTEPDSNEEDDTIASHVARRRRTSTASQEDETRRKCKEPKMSEPKDSNRRTTSRNSENERKSTEKASVSREQSPEIDMSITHCICQTMYDEKKFYVMCDTCARWFHGECVKLTEKLAARLTVWNCHECDDEAQRIKQSPQLYCICQTPYDDTKFYVGCDACEGWFHPQCVNITQEDAEEMAEYNCPSCLEAQDDDNKETGYESTSSDYSITSFSSTMPLTRIDYQRLWELLEMLLEHRLSTPFRQPVDERRYPDYRQVISQPMDLSAITKKFEALEYRSLREFVVDVTLMFENAKTYNPKSSHVFLAAERMQEVFDEKLAETRARMKATLSGEAPSSNARRHVSECHTLEGSLDIDTDQLISTQIDPNIMRYL